MKKLWALVDGNSFFASCEMVFRPDLKHKPVVVLSSNDGCIIAANHRAKSLGLKMFGPYFEMKKLLQFNGAVVFSSNFPLYADISRRVNLILSEFTPALEIYSIDECFLDLQGLALPGGSVSFGQSIRKRINQCVGVDTGVGIAPTKVLAKLANHLAKKHGVFEGVCSLELESDQELWLKKVPIEKVWGIGRKTAPKLRALGIRDAWDFRIYPNEKLLYKEITKLGVALQQELRGISCLQDELEESKKKQLLCSKSFEYPRTLLTELRDIVADFAGQVGEKLRQQESCCYMVEVFIQTSPHVEGPHYFNQAYHRFNAPTSDTRKIVRGALQALSQIFKEGLNYKRAGVILYDIVDKNQQQGSLFGQGDEIKDDLLMEVMDSINNREGFDTIKVAACATASQNVSRKEMKSPAYTSRWTEIPVIKN